MSRWKLRNPSIFPIHFSEVVLHAHETGKDTLLQTLRNDIEARSYRDKFREWRRNLRDHPNGRTARAGGIEAEFRITTYLRTEDSLCEVWVSIKPKNTANTLNTLNPDLIDIFGQ